MKESKKIAISKIERCPKCKGKLRYRKFVSMGPGYSEWETGGDDYYCPKCKKSFESICNPGTDWHVERANDLLKGKTRDAHIMAQEAFYSAQVSRELGKARWNPIHKNSSRESWSWLVPIALIGALIWWNRNK